MTDSGPENLQSNKEVSLLWKGARREEEKGKDTALRHLLVWAVLREGEGLVPQLKARNRSCLILGRRTAGQHLQSFG